MVSPLHPPRSSLSDQRRQCHSGKVDAVSHMGTIARAIADLTGQDQGGQSYRMEMSMRARPAY